MARWLPSSDKRYNQSKYTTIISDIVALYDLFIQPSDEYSVYLR